MLSLNTNYSFHLSLYITNLYNMLVYRRAHSKYTLFIMYNKEID